MYTSPTAREGCRVHRKFSNKTITLVRDAKIKKKQYKVASFRSGMTICFVPSFLGLTTEKILTLDEAITTVLNRFRTKDAGPQQHQEHATQRFDMKTQSYGSARYKQNKTILDRSPSSTDRSHGTNNQPEIIAPEQQQSYSLVLGKEEKSKASRCAKQSRRRKQ